jgi:NADH-quinone oxidoreductase subunit G
VTAETVRALADLLRGGEDVVIVWGERMGPDALGHLLNIARRLGLAGRDGAGLLEIPAGSNGRGLREAGVLPNAGPGYSPVPEPGRGRGAGDIARAAASSELTALYLFETDPVRDHPGRQLWSEALQRAALVVAHAAVLTDGLREHADVVFPAESYAEKEGTVVHPDGRVQRLRSAIGHPGDVRAGWWVLAELSRRIGLDTGLLTSGMAFARLVEAVPFYRGLTLETIGGRGMRWPEREDAARDFARSSDSEQDAARDFARSSDSEQDAAREFARSSDSEQEAAREFARSSDSEQESAQATPARGRDELPDGALRLGRYRPIWAAPEIELSPALHYTIARQLLELSPEDARRLGLASGESVVVSENGNRLKATAHIRTGVPAGTAFLADGLASDSANALTGSAISVTKSDAAPEMQPVVTVLPEAPDDGRDGAG